MRKDSQLSRALHILIHLGQKPHPVTSETISKMLKTNPVVVRRMMGRLRENGYVTSVKGHNGGWSLSRSLREITLLDIHKALGDKNLFTIGFTEPDSKCLIEKAVNTQLEQTMKDAEAVLLDKFAKVTLNDLNISDSES
ncbi:UNVERIFIED_ORG: BadM/Rrf2 family transcriptional regulator [Idiomarina abyssalis]|uniref:Predicted transcriptional regulator, rrf2 family n=1 Tax=Idiomarina loihiensis (strain ATCC BAA-735 / DSM 15497 / L2-TR) TaxID=283942 RepID=Q5R0U6_IDILO|nr:MULTISPECIES: Rrf2 family transcriptional regulator [Idiomarina]AAV82439.1 Predicted transcriptional regulator, rrf2 family [Idiomarina loihiensis L2TR]AGM36476.1 rf2 family transcriptional regulator [Idiomarina loihiensis GSL 199]TDO53876.1 BadM/Rrf2 family transcriptional regulator [Idiomarina sp. 017G]